MPKLVIENMGWDDSRFKELKQTMIPFVKKLSDYLNLENNIIIHLYKNKNEKDDKRAEFDEGIVILFENTPDPRGDFVHEFGHQLFPIEKASITIKTRLKKLQRTIEKRKGDGRIFVQEHTYSTAGEVFCTLFKWYILGKITNDAYLEVLDNFIPEGRSIVEKVLLKEKLIKSKEEIRQEIKEKLLKSISDEDKDSQAIEKARKVILNKIDKFGLSKSQEELYLDLAANEIMNRKMQGRLEDFKTIAKGKYPEVKIDKIGLSNPVGIFDKYQFKSFVENGFNHLNGNVLKFNLGMNKEIKDDLIKNDPVQDETVYNGIKIDVEWIPGSVRQWKGCPYKNPMVKTSYGYIRNTGSEDGEELDVYLRENPLKDAKVYRLSQLDKKGFFDEHKFGLGFKDEKEFKTAYCNAMPKEMCGSIDVLIMEKFKKEILKMYKKVSNG